LSNCSPTRFSCLPVLPLIPFGEARTYHFALFDSTAAWSHADNPLHEIGRLTLGRNPTDFQTNVEQAAFEPNNLRARIGVMSLGRQPHLIYDGAESTQVVSDTTPARLACLASRHGPPADPPRRSKVPRSRGKRNRRRHGLIGGRSE
jgi:Catalase